MPLDALKIEMIKVAVLNYVRRFWRFKLFIQKMNLKISSILQKYLNQEIMSRIGRLLRKSQYWTPNYQIPPHTGFLLVWH